MGLQIKSTPCTRTQHSEAFLRPPDGRSGRDAAGLAAAINWFLHAALDIPHLFVA